MPTNDGRKVFERKKDYVFALGTRLTELRVVETKRLFFNKKVLVGILNLICLM